MAHDEHGWHVEDGTATEVEVRALLAALVRALKPRLVVETGCYRGFTTQELGHAAMQVEGCRVVTCDTDPLHAHEARMRCAGLPVEVRECRGIELPELRRADFAFIDSVYADRAAEVALLPLGALAIVHDTNVCKIEGVDLGGVVTEHGGLLFDTYRGFGMLRKKVVRPWA